MTNFVESYEDKLLREESNYRKDKLVEKWSKVEEIGNGIKDMPTQVARNLAQLLENQTRNLARYTEAQVSNDFMGQTPENLLRIIRLSYPNSIRGRLFTEIAMETMNDSIKYVYPKYTNSYGEGFQQFKTPAMSMTAMDGALDDDTLNDPTSDTAMYESTESRYATEFREAPECKINAGTVTAKFTSGAFGENGAWLRDGATKLYIVDKKTGKRVAIAAQDKGDWMFATNREINANSTGSATVKVSVTNASLSNGTYTFTVTEASSGSLDGYTFVAVARFDSERDLLGEYLGEVAIGMKTYVFRPRPITLGVTWTHMTELALDTSFGLAAEEMLLDYASQEIKKTLDFQAVKHASDIQSIKASGNFVKFNAEATDMGSTKDSYFHTAQLVTQAIARVKSVIYNKLNRGGVSAIVGGPAAVQYLSLHKGWSDRGREAAIGGYKAGEIDGIPVFMVPSNIIPDSELLTTWKNENASGDVAYAIGTLVPFYSTGVIQRKTLYKEAALARYEDSVVLNPNYFGRIRIENIRELN